MPDRTAQAPEFLETLDALYVVDGRVRASEVRKRLGMGLPSFRRLLGEIGEMPLSPGRGFRTPVWLPLEVAAQLIDERSGRHGHTK